MGAVAVPARARLGRALPPRRLLAVAGDERLVEQIRRGNEAAFEVVYERYSAGLLGFCRHMLGSPEDAEEAVQHAFAAAYRQLLRDERPIQLKPWLYTIARNRCLSLLRARREYASEELEQREVATVGLDQQVHARADLRELLRGLGELPEDQRAALLLSELGALSHIEVAQVLGCEGSQVRGLVFRARSGLLERREACETPCEEIREQLSNLRGGSLRRRGLRHHLSACAGCRDFRERVMEQRAMLAIALPVAPSAALKSSALGSLGLGAGGSGGAGGAALGGASAATVGSTGSATVGAALAKVAVVSVLVGGGGAGVAATSALDDRRDGALTSEHALDGGGGRAAEGQANPYQQAGALASRGRVVGSILAPFDRPSGDTSADFWRGDNRGSEPRSQVADRGRQGEVDAGAASGTPGVVDAGSAADAGQDVGAASGDHAGGSETMPASGGAEHPKPKWPRRAQPKLKGPSTTLIELPRASAPKDRPRKLNRSRPTLPAPRIVSPAPPSSTREQPQRTAPGANRGLDRAKEMGAPGRAR